MKFLIKSFNSIKVKFGLKFDPSDEAMKNVKIFCYMFIITQLYNLYRLSLENHHLKEIYHTLKEEENLLMMKYNDLDERKFLLDNNFITEEEKIRLLQAKKASQYTEDANEKV